MAVADGVRDWTIDTVPVAARVPSSPAAKCGPASAAPDMDDDASGGLAEARMAGTPWEEGDWHAKQSTVTATAWHRAVVMARSLTGPRGLFGQGEPDVRDTAFPHLA